MYVFAGRPVCLSVCLPACLSVCLWLQLLNLTLAACHGQTLHPWSLPACVCAACMLAPLPSPERTSEASCQATFWSFALTQTAVVTRFKLQMAHTAVNCWLMVKMYAGIKRSASGEAAAAAAKKQKTTPLATYQQAQEHLRSQPTHHVCTCHACLAQTGPSTLPLPHPT